MGFYFKGSSKKEKMERRAFLDAHPSLEKNSKLHFGVGIGFTVAGALTGGFLTKNEDGFMRGLLLGGILGLGAIYLHKQKLIKDDEENSK